MNAHIVIVNILYNVIFFLCRVEKRVGVCETRWFVYEEPRFNLKSTRAVTTRTMKVYTLPSELLCVLSCVVLNSLPHTYTCLCTYHFQSSSAKLDLTILYYIFATVTRCLFFLVRISYKGGCYDGCYILLSIFMRGKLL